VSDDYGWLITEAAAQRSKPQPAQTLPQPGSMEWFEAQKKKKG
jgi:hypothetical protein